jgi:hypothetical protein
MPFELSNQEKKQMGDVGMDPNEGIAPPCADCGKQPVTPDGDENRCDDCDPSTYKKSSRPESVPVSISEKLNDCGDNSNRRNHSKED